jgi:EmrB/QacA subfamily drug resistance transporter
VLFEPVPVGIDVTIVSVALPQIGRSLHAGLAGLEWITDAYTLVLASFLIPSGSLADRYGRRRIYLAGLSLFAAGSAACSLAPGLAWLEGFRAAQALGGSMLNPVSMAIIRATFAHPAARARATGIWTAAFGGGLALGPVAGGFLVSATGWRGVFWAAVPVGVATIVLTALLVPESCADSPRRPDLAGQLLVTLLMGSLVYAIIAAPSAGWESPRVLAALAVCPAAAGLLVRAERGRDEPLIDPRLQSSAAFAGSAVVAFSAFAALNSCLFLATLWLQDVGRYPAAAVGTYVLPMAALTVILAPAAGRYSAIRGPLLPMAAGGLAITAAGIMLSRLGPATPLGWLIAACAVVGTGYALVNAPATHAAVGAFPPGQADVAAGIISASRQAGSALGVAIAGSVTAAGLHVTLSAGFASAAQPGWLITTGYGLLILIGGLIAARGRLRPGRLVISGAPLVSPEPASLRIPSRSPGERGETHHIRIRGTSDTAETIEFPASRSADERLPFA